MAISFDDIENAFFFVSMDQMFMHNAYLCNETGQIFYTSEMGDSDELPEDIDDPAYNHYEAWCSCNSITTP